MNAPGLNEKGFKQMVSSLLFVVGKMGTMSLNCLPALINVCQSALRCKLLSTC